MLECLKCGKIYHSALGVGVFKSGVALIWQIFFIYVWMQYPIYSIFPFFQAVMKIWTFVALAQEDQNLPATVQILTTILAKLLCVPASNRAITMAHVMLLQENVPVHLIGLAWIVH